MTALPLAAALLAAALLVNLGPLGAQPNLKYPETRKDPAVVDTYHGTAVPDPYRWLEDDRSAETAAWVKAQNEVTFGYLAQIPFRQQIRSRLEQLWNYERYSAPYKRGGWVIFSKNDGLQNHAVTYFQKKLEDTPQVLIDPNTFSKDGTASLSMLSLSPDGRYAAYGISEAGSDWQRFRVRDLTTRRDLTDELKRIKFSAAAWAGNGFYYCRYPDPKGSELSEVNQGQQIYFHRIGTPQSQDQLFYEDPAHPKRYFGVETTEDNRWLLVTVSEGATSTNEVHLRDLKDPKGSLKPLFTGFAHSYDFIDLLPDGRFLFKTNHQAPKYRLIAVDPQQPQPEQWQVIVPELEAEVLGGITRTGDHLLVQTMRDATARLYAYSLTGARLSEVPLPGLGTVAGPSGKANDPDAFFIYTDYTTPPTVYRYDARTRQTSVFRQPKYAADVSRYESEQVFVTSKDGTRVPMILVRRKGLPRDGQRPTLLYGYGGFNISVTPSFSPAVFWHVENGGMYAVVNLRGGGEYGEAWHNAGKRLLKQNVFDDCVAAARWLLASGWTSTQHLGLHGRSNGGLLVAAVANQHPELFRVAIPGVGVLDMLRYHKFTVGWGWVPEYGSADEADQFPNLYRLSPLHNLRPGIEYPSTLVMTSDHDDRVVPAHSFKYAARLQEVYQGPNPQLIRIETSAGHGAGLPTAKQIDQWADFWSFLYHEMRTQPQAQ